MYSVNDTVLYGNYGVCRVTDIREQDFGETGKLYYILVPLYEKNAVIYCPLETENLRMRPLLSKEETETLISQMTEPEFIWTDNAQRRKELYRLVLKEGDRMKLASLIHSLYLVRIRKEKAGKKLSASDEDTLKTAEKILHSEFAYVLGFELSQVKGYLRERLGEIKE